MHVRALLFSVLVFLVLGTTAGCEKAGDNSASSDQALPDKHAENAASPDTLLITGMPDSLAANVP